MVQRAFPERSELADCLAVGNSEVEGKGLFARRTIQAGEVLIVYGGRLIGDAELGALGPHSTLAVAEGQHLVQAQDDPAQYVNHSCDSNAWLRDQITLIARRPIETGDEVTLDYALVTSQSDWDMCCDCGASNCRGTITGNDWQQPILQRRYTGHFSPFINERIRRLA